MGDKVKQLIQYSGTIPGGLPVGRTIKIHGSTSELSQRFGVNLICGEGGDVALQIEVNFNDNSVVINTVENKICGQPKQGINTIKRGKSFKLKFLVCPDYYKIKINHRRFTDFHHRVSNTRITHLSIEGDLTVTSVTFKPRQPLPSHGKVKQSAGIKHQQDDDDYFCAIHPGQFKHHPGHHDAHHYLHHGHHDVHHHLHHGHHDAHHHLHHGHNHADIGHHDTSSHFDTGSYDTSVTSTIDTGSYDTSTTSSYDAPSSYE